MLEHYLLFKICEIARSLKHKHTRILSLEESTSEKQKLL